MKVKNQFYDFSEALVTNNDVIEEGDTWKMKSLKITSLYF